MLLEAGGSKEFAGALQDLQTANLNRLAEELNGFVQKFDHRYADRPWGNSKDAHLRTAYKYQGK